MDAVEGARVSVAVLCMVRTWDHMAFSSTGAP